MVELLCHPRVSSIVSDQCEYGLLTHGPDGTPMPAKKPTRWASSSPHMLKRLSKRCSQTHVHQQLVGGRAKKCEDYPLDLITEILRGIRDTADHEEEWGDELVSALDARVMGAGLLHDVKCSSLVAAYRAQDLKEETQKLSVKFKHRNGNVEEVKLAFKDSYKDEYTCEELPIGHVRLAMQEELAYFCDKVWVGVPISEALADPDGKIIGSRWVNCNKNDINDPDVRCRLVAQEVNLHPDDSFYAATPPLEAKRMLFSEWASNQDVYRQLSFIDVKKAYFYGVPDRSLYIKFPPELGMPKDMVGKLVRCMYGTRDAGSIWEGCYTKCLVDLGFEQGVASPCCFWHPQWQVSVVVHGDDFTALGTPEGLNQYEAGMCQAFECKLKGRLGRGENDLKEMRVLNRIVRIDDNGLRYEADPRHVELLARSLNLEQCRHVVTPGVKEPYDEEAPTISDDNLDDHVLDGSVNSIRTGSRTVRFSDVVEFHDVPNQLGVYGSSPSTFDFNKYGRMVPRIHRSKEEYEESIAPNVSPNRRRSILDHVLRHGAAWEIPSVEILAKLTKASKKKYLKPRMGTKAAKQYERLECAGDLLDEEASTMFRALAARYLYLSMDRPECAFSSNLIVQTICTSHQESGRGLKAGSEVFCGNAPIGVLL